MRRLLDFVVVTAKSRKEGRMNRRSHAFKLMAGLWLAVGLTFPVPATAATEQAKLTASDGSASDRLGISVAVSGDTAVAGAPREGPGPLPTEHGAAYVFTRSAGTWTEQAKLTASDAMPFDKLGFSVAVSGDTVVAGAPRDPGDPTEPGAAYVFTRTAETWSQQAKLTASDGAVGNQFGYSVAVSGDTLVVGAVTDDVGGNIRQGSAYVYTRTGGTWTQQGPKITAAKGAAGDGFGQSVAVSGDTAVVGAISGDGAVDDQGSAHVFTRTGGTWTEEATLNAADGSANDQFGFWVGVDGDTAVVGAPFDDVGARDQGSAYVFARIAGSWPQQSQLTASDGAQMDLFGRSVAVSGDTIVVGAQYDDVGTSIKQGSAYVFTRTGAMWPEETKLAASDGAVGALFGVSVGVSGDTAVVGAGFETVGPNVHQGAAYVFVVPSAVAPTSVTIDVKPGNTTNRIRTSGSEAIPVAVMTTATFDATTVDPSTVCFGDDPPAGGTTAYNQPPGVDADCNEAHRRGHVKDADGDGDLDMVLHFETRQTGIDSGDAEASLTGRTTGGTSFDGSDAIRTAR